MLSMNHAESLARIVDRSHLPDLSQQTLLDAFQAEGIRSLEDVAREMACALRDDTGRPESILHEELFREPTPPRIVRGIRQRIPRVPIVIEDQKHDPREISRFDGVELALIPQRDGAELLVLTDKSTWAPFARALLLAQAVRAGLRELEEYQYGGYSFVTPKGGPIVVGRPAPTFGPPVPPPAPQGISLYSDINLSGSALTLWPGESYRDLRKVGWWIFATDWNDRISSVHRSANLCLAFEHIHFTGTSLFLGPSNDHTLDLHTFGFNDRISSVINSG